MIDVGANKMIPVARGWATGERRICRDDAVAHGEAAALDRVCRQERLARWVGDLEYICRIRQSSSRLRCPRSRTAVQIHIILALILVVVDLATVRDSSEYGARWLVCLGRRRDCQRGHKRQPERKP